MADSDYGGYSGGGYSEGYSGYSGDYAGDGGLSALEPVDVGSFGPVASVSVGDSDFGDSGLSALEQMTLEGWGPVAGVNADVGFDSIGDLSPLSPMDVGSFGPVASVTAGQTSGFDWDNILGFFDKLARNPITSVALAKSPLAPLLGIYNLARASQTPQGAAKAWGGMAGSQIGQAALGPAGGVVGGILGQFAGSKSGGLPGYTGERTAQEPGSGESGMDLEQIFSKGLGIYQANREAQQAGRMASTLGDLYGQNSPYAQALRQQLERRDAAAGRRSQYGPREVELQAKLAGLYANTAPQTMAAQQQAQGARNQRIDNILGLARATGALPWAQKQLGDLWNTPTDMSGFQTPYEMPSYTDYASQAYTPSSFGEIGTGTYGGNDFFLNY